MEKCLRNHSPYTRPNRRRAVSRLQHNTSPSAESSQELMKKMELDIDDIPNNSPLKTYSSEVASQDKMIIRIKKQEQDVDIESKDLSMDHEEIVSYTCEFVQKVDDNKSDLDDDLCDESIESVRQDENFIYPAITNSDDEDINDMTWQPPSTILTPGERLARKHIKCLYPKVNKSSSKKRKYKKNKVTEEPTVKRVKKERLSKSKKILEDSNLSKPGVDLSDEIVTSESITKKVCDSLTPKVCKPRKGMATPKQRLGRIIKIHKMMK